MNHIRLRKNNLRIESVSALKLARKYKTPFYCYSLAQLKNNFNYFRNAFRAIKPSCTGSAASRTEILLS